MSTLHGDFRIISNCSSSFGPLTEKSLPLASVYYPNGRLRREILAEEMFQRLVYGILNGIGETFLMTTQFDREVFANQDGRVPLVLSETIQATARARISDLEKRLIKKSSAINSRIHTRIKLVEEGEGFLHSYLGEEIVFDAAKTREEVELWKRKHLEVIFGFEVPERFPKFDQFERLLKEKFSRENEQRSNYWEEKVVNGSFRIVQYPDVGDVVCYLGCLPFVEGVVDESANVDVKGDLHTIFEREEYGREVIFLRKKPELLLGGSD